MGSRLSLKDGTVKIAGVQPETVFAIFVVKEIYDRMVPPDYIGSFPFVLTSVKDAKHMKGSKHYDGQAFDLRTWVFKEHSRLVNIDAFAEACRSSLGRDFDVVIEKDHIHIEFDPK